MERLVFGGGAGRAVAEGGEVEDGRLGFPIAFSLQGGAEIRKYQMILIQLGRIRSGAACASKPRVLGAIDETDRYSFEGQSASRS